MMRLTDKFIRQEVSTVVIDHQDAVIHKVKPADGAIVIDQTVSQLAIIRILRGNLEHCSKEVMVETTMGNNRHAVIRAQMAFLDPI